MPIRLISAVTERDSCDFCTSPRYFKECLELFSHSKFCLFILWFLAKPLPLVGKCYYNYLNDFSQTWYGRLFWCYFSTGQFKSHHTWWTQWIFMCTFKPMIDFDQTWCFSFMCYLSFVNSFPISVTLRVDIYVHWCT